MSETTKQLEAGRELDALIAKKVMGFVVVNKNTQPEMVRRATGCVWNGSHCGIIRISGRIDKWKPTTNIRDAWDVVEKLRPSHWVKVTAGRAEGNEDAPYNACSISEYSGAGEYLVYAIGNTAPLAICRAAMAFVERKGVSE